jgi:SAM-dependent methyltransferase
VYSIQQKYRQIKESYIKELGYDVPENYRSSFINYGGAADVQFIYKQIFKNIPSSSKILIVGVMGGRDYFLLKNLGYNVAAIDIGEQPDIEPIIICNIEETLPFPKDTFDAVLIGEVLEHLKEDTRALNNISKVLKLNGIIVVSIPFYHDMEEGHMRIHSPISGRRLLSMGGFEVEDYLERPGIFWFRRGNYFLHGLNLISYTLFNKTIYSWLTNILGNFEWKFGHKLWLRPIRRISKCFGGYYVCKKAECFDYLDLNIKLYTSKKDIKNINNVRNQ